MTKIGDICKLIKDGSDDYLVLDKKSGFAVIFTQKKELYEPTNEMVMGDSRITKIFRKIDSTHYEEVDFQKIREEMTAFLAGLIDVTALAREVIETTSPEELLEAHTRLQDPEIRNRARSTIGCYGILIDPVTPSNDEKTGKPLKIYVRS